MFILAHIKLHKGQFCTDNHKKSLKSTYVFIVQNAFVVTVTVQIYIVTIHMQICLLILSLLIYTHI